MFLSAYKSTQTFFGKTEDKLIIYLLNLFELNGIMNKINGNGSDMEVYKIVNKDLNLLPSEFFVIFGIHYFPRKHKIKKNFIFIFTKYFQNNESMLLYITVLFVDNLRSNSYLFLSLSLYEVFLGGARFELIYHPINQICVLIVIIK